MDGVPACLPARLCVSVCVCRLVDGLHSLCPVELATDMVIKQPPQQQQPDGPQ